MGYIETRLGARGGTFIKEAEAKAYPNEVGNIILHSDISVKDLIEFREAIEGLAAMMAAKKIEPVQIEQLAFRLNAFKMAMDGDEFTLDQVFPWDMEMHLKLAEISGNVLLKANVKLFQYKMKQMLPGTIPIDKSLVADCLADWEQIIDALERGQADKLSSCVRAHIRKFSEFFFQEGERLQRDTSSVSNQTIEQRAAISESNQEAILLFAGANISAGRTLPNHTPKVKEWHFPALTWWTGEWSLLGKEAKFGIDIAVEEINAGGGIQGIPVRLTWYDTGFDLEKTRSQI